MTVSAAASYEVRFRASGTTDNWSDIQTFKPGQEIRLTATNRARSYDAQARAVSRCGARSSWVPATVTVDDANQRVGQGNVDMLTIAGQRSAWVGLAISYSSSQTSATISCSAGTLRDGANNPSFAASSVTVSGTAGTTVTYWLYYDDPRGLGGTFPLGATTVYEDLIAQGRAWVGQVNVVFPTTGSGSGGGGTGGGGIGCVEVDAIVLVIDENGVISPRRAGDVKVGDQLWGADEVTLEPKVYTVSYSEAKLQPGVEINDVSNAARLRCSTSAPIPTPDGLRKAPEVAGEQVASRGSVPDSASCWTPVGVIRGVGKIMVQHISAENGCFWASSDGLNFILHHNLKPGPT